MDYIETPIQPYRVGRTSTKMSQKQSTPEVKAPKAKYSKTRGEHIKDIVITALVIGIITFIGGMKFQGDQQEAINTAVNSATINPVLEAPAKK
jgi:hypothetical protein